MLVKDCDKFLYLCSQKIASCKFVVSGTTKGRSGTNNCKNDANGRFSELGIADGHNYKG